MLDQHRHPTRNPVKIDDGIEVPRMHGIFLEFGEIGAIAIPRSDGDIPALEGTRRHCRLGQYAAFVRIINIGKVVAEHHRTATQGCCKTIIKIKWTAQAFEC